MQKKNKYLIIGAIISVVVIISMVFLINYGNEYKSKCEEAATLDWGYNNPKCLTWGQSSGYCECVEKVCLKKSCIDSKRITFDLS